MKELGQHLALVRAKQHQIHTMYQNFRESAVKRSLPNMVNTVDVA
jgi:hypothetical protein